jgi:hypothetical protein
MSTCIIKHGIHISTNVMHLSLDFVNYRYVDRVCMFSCLDSGPWRQDSSAPPLLLTIVVKVIFFLRREGSSSYSECTMLGNSRSNKQEILSSQWKNLLLCTPEASIGCFLEDSEDTECTCTPDKEMHEKKIFARW